MAKTRASNGSATKMVIVDDGNERELNRNISTLIHKDVKVVAKNNSQKELIKSIKANEITICSGKAGTGKSYVSIAMALNLLRKQQSPYKKIYLVKSVTTLTGEELGYLKGDLQQKFEPFLWSFIINAEKVIDDNAIKGLIDYDIVRPLPLAYIRGITLDNCIVLADEMQNVRLDNSRTLLSRIGENCKMILLGDTEQIDLRNKKESSLECLLNMFDGMDEIGTIRMNSTELNCRNPIIDKIEEKYERYYRENPRK
jgi:phosphate starvation-inducible PhoH-like protein